METVEIISISPNQNSSVMVTGKLTGKDLNEPMVTVYYGNENGGFDKNGWDNSIEVAGGQSVGLGEFNATIDGLIPGQNYYFRTFAESDDGEDWSSGDPQVIDDLL